MAAKQTFQPQSPQAGPGRGWRLGRGPRRQRSAAPPISRRAFPRSSCLRLSRPRQPRDVRRSKGPRVVRTEPGEPSSGEPSSGEPQLNPSSRSERTAVVISPSAMPRRAELSIGYFPDHVAMTLVATNTQMTCQIVDPANCQLPGPAAVRAIQSTGPAATTTLPGSASTTLTRTANTVPPSVPVTLPAPATGYPSPVGHDDSAAVPLDITAPAREDGYDDGHARWPGRRHDDAAIGTDPNRRRPARKSALVPGHGLGWRSTRSSRHDGRQYNRPALGHDHASRGPRQPPLGVPVRLPSPRAREVKCGEG